MIIWPHGLTTAPRESLIVALAAAVGDKRAEAIVDALDTYLAEGEDRARSLFVAHRDPEAELDKMRAERDAALDRAEEAEEELRRLKSGQKRGRGS